MLKLLKYELKQTWKMCITLLCSTLVGCMALVFNPFTSASIMFVFYIMLFGLIVIGSSISLFVYCMSSFNQEFTKPQGYLMMTLPITARDFVWAKFINQLLWNALSGISIAGTFLYFIRHHLHSQLSVEKANMPSLLQLTNNSLVSYLLTVFIIYFSIVLFSRQPSNSNNNFAKIILIIVLTYIIGVVTGAISILAPYSIRYGIPLNLEDLRQLGYYLQNNANSLNTFNSILNIIISVMFYFATVHIIEKQVQL